VSDPIWKKGAISLDEAVQTFCAADDVVIDRAFFLADIAASKAHADGLVRIGVLSEGEGQVIGEALGALGQRFTEGTFELDARYEDGQSAIESVLIDELGDVGRKIHTGRSRNDQVLVAVRLWLRDRLDDARAHTLAAAEALLLRARATERVPMPGYTHLQPAMPTSLGAWHAGHAEGLLDSAQALGAARELVNANPLGSGSGFGVNLALDRDGVARDLEMARSVVVAQTAQTSRGKLELFCLQALHLATLDVRRLAWDLSLFQMSELAFVRLPDAYTTGSSLMPNKRNPDVVELLRALPAVVEGALAETQAILNLPSSYHRDLQGTKAPLVRAFSRALQGIMLVPRLVEACGWNEERMAAAITPDMHATDRALELVKEGVPFRDAYVRAAKEIPALGARTPAQSLQARVSLGGAANLGLDRLEARLRALR
jgi:argininosuccinate lyase